MLIVIFKRHFSFVIFYLTSLIFLLASIFVLYKRHNQECRFLWAICLLYLFWGFTGLALIQILDIPARTKLFPSLLLFAIMIFCSIKIYAILSARLQTYAVCLVLAISLSYCVFVGSEYLKHRIRWENMLNFIQEQKIQGVADIVVPSRIFESRYSNFGDFGNPGVDPQEWPNTTYAKHFGVRSFRVDDPKERNLND